MASMFGNFGTGNCENVDRPSVKLFPNRLFVGGMSRETTEEEIFQLFSRFGQVKSTKIITDVEGSSKGYGFVTFASEEEAQRIRLAMPEIILHNRKLNIGPAMKRNLTPNQEVKYEPLTDYSTFFPFLASNNTADPMFPQQMLPYYGIPFNFPYGIQYPLQNGISYQYPF